MGAWSPMRPTDRITGGDKIIRFCGLTITVKMTFFASVNVSLVLPNSLSADARHEFPLAPLL